MGISAMDTIRSRRSVRTYTGEPLTEAQYADIEAGLSELAQAYSVKLALLKNEYQNREFGTYGMNKNPVAYFAAVCGRDKEALIQASIALEKGVLRCTEMGLGTCWLGGSFNRGEFGSALTGAVQKKSVILINRLSAKGTDGVMKRGGFTVKVRVLYFHRRVCILQQPEEVSGGAV